MTENPNLSDETKKLLKELAEDLSELSNEAKL